jgi:ribosomal RNA-processing protein 9
MHVLLHVRSLRSLVKERALTSGSDKTVRLWKIPEESQLLFRGPKVSIDCCCMVNEDQFFTGGQVRPSVLRHHGCWLGF